MLHYVQYDMKENGIMDVLNSKQAILIQKYVD